MFVFYDPADINQARAVYSYLDPTEPDPVAWDAFTKCSTVSKLTSGVHLLHHKIDIQPANVFDLVEMTAAEKTAHPIP